MTAPLIVEIPIRIESVANKREHWSVKAERTRRHRGWGFLFMNPAGLAPALPCAVMLTRIAPRQLDDDNLRSAFKALRDGIADRLGVKDNDPRVRWDYAQERGKPREYAARVTITEVRDVVR